MFDLLNKATSKQKIGTFWDEVKLRAVTERGEKPILTSPWIRDYCELLADPLRSNVYTVGCSQVGKSYFAFLNANYQAARGYRVLIILPTQEALLRNQKNQITPISRSWDSVTPLGTQVWQGRGKGALIFGYASTSGGAPSKARDGLANTGGSGSAVSADWLIVDEVSQITGDALAPFERRLDAGVLDSRPCRYLGTAGGGGGIERFTLDSPQVYPQCHCPSCHTDFPLDPYKCLFLEVAPSGWISEWNKTAAGDPIVRCPHCGSEVSDPLETTRIKAPDSPTIGLFLTPLLRRGNPTGDLIRSMQTAQRNGAGPMDWLQQALGVPSSLQGFLRIEPGHLVQKFSPIGNDSFQGIFYGVDQGIGTHYGAKISVFQSPKGLPVIKVMAIESGDSGMIQSMNNGSTLGLIDTVPDRTLALTLQGSLQRLELARQKYNLGYINEEAQVKIGDWEYPVIELPVNAAITIFNAAVDGRLSFDCPVTDQAKKHLLSVAFDSKAYKLIRPANHEDDLFYALFFAVSAFDLHRSRTNP